MAYPLGHWWAKGVFGLGAKMLMHSHTAPLKASVKPKLFLIGDNDDFTAQSTMRKFAGKCASPWDIKVFPGADHFAFVSGPWWGFRAPTRRPSATPGSAHSMHMKKQPRD